MLSTSLFVAAALCIGIHAQSPVANPSPLASGPPRSATITVTEIETEVSTLTATETSFVTVVNTVINNVTVAVTEIETNTETDFVTGFVTNFVTDVETQVITNVQTLPAVTETDKVTLPPVTVHDTLTITKPAVTVSVAHTVTATKTVVETATNPLASLCPGGNEEVFEAERGVFIIVCSSSFKTTDLIPGGQTTDSVYDCAELCDGLTAAGVQCSAGNFEASSSLCFPQAATAGSSITPAPGFDTAVLNSTMTAGALSAANKKRSSWLF